MQRGPSSSLRESVSRLISAPYGSLYQADRAALPRKSWDLLSSMIIHRGIHLELARIIDDDGFSPRS